MIRKYVALSAVAFVLAACAQQEEPEPVAISVQPSYDKIGNASCPAGYQLTTTDTGATVCDPL